ncbi:hypothetical protein AHX61_004453 [Salmonella enterica subsp. enterica serovar Albuquerque]|nr:hypothetical protein [Salmonella enterica subsp. enterica serovar Albuquerque]
MTGVRRWKHKQKLTAFCRNGRVLLLKGQLIKKSCQYRVTSCIREMADAGNFGGSVPENAYSTMPLLRVMSDCGSVFLPTIPGVRLCHNRVCVLRSTWTDYWR